MLFDTHVHLNDDQFSEDVEDVIARAKAAGVDYMLVVGFDRKTIERALELIEQYDFLYASVGWHPVDAIDMTDEDLVWLEQVAAHPKVVALGEMGLDYHWDKSPQDIQNKFFASKLLSRKNLNYLLSYITEMRRKILLTS